MINFVTFVGFVEVSVLDRRLHGYFWTCFGHLSDTQKNMAEKEYLIGQDLDMT